MRRLRDYVPDEWLAPHNLEAEQACIGSIMLENDAFDVVDAILPEDAFFRKSNAAIYQAMRDLREDGEPIDVVTLASKLQAKSELESVGGVSYLSSIAGSVPTVSNVAYYAKEVRKCSIQRMACRITQDIYDQAKAQAEPEQIAALLDQAAAIMLDCTAKGEDFRPMPKVIMEAYEQIEHRALNQSENGITGIASGFTDLDKMTAGFQRGDLIIMAARPSVGKTALLGNIIENAGIEGKANVALFSLEMGATQLGQRSISSRGNIDASRIRTGRLEFDDWDRVASAAGLLADTNIYIDDTPGISVSEIRAKCRRLKKRLGRLDLIGIDYLQLITLRGRHKENRQQEVSEISRTLKQIARELDVPVIALSQLSRGVEQRQDKRPMMSDLRESGSIEQDADLVAFLYRDDYYDKESEKKNIIEIIIAKQRNGPVGTVELAFLKNFNKFTGLDRSHQEHATG
nr:replicative DNA helicase [Paenibacillus tyrfis]